MPWIINDGIGNNRVENCALVTAAALYSHVAGQGTTSGELMMRVWRGMADEASNKRLDDLEPAKLCQNENAIWGWAYARQEIQKDKGEFQKNLEKYNTERAKGALFTQGLSFSTNYIQHANSAQWAFIKDIAETAPSVNAGDVLVKTGLGAKGVVEQVSETVKNRDCCLFALHSHRLGHWVLGHARKPTAQNPNGWDTTGIALEFADYQPQPPKRADWPFLGEKPSAGSGEDDCTVVIVRGAQPNAQGWPAEVFQGPFEKFFADQLADSAQSSEGSKSVLFVDTEVATEVPLGANTKV